MFDVLCSVVVLWAFWGVEGVLFDFLEEQGLDNSRAKFHKFKLDLSGPQILWFIDLRTCKLEALHSESLNGKPTYEVHTII